MAEYSRAAALPGIDVIGIDMHIGSQLTKVNPFVDSIEKLKIMIGTLRGEGIELKYFD